MVRRPSIISCRYAEAKVSQIRPYKYQDTKTCTSVIGFDENSLYLYCSGQEMPCSEEEYIQVENPQAPGVINNLCDKVLADKLFGFLQVDIQAPDELLEKFKKVSFVRYRSCT